MRPSRIPSTIERAVKAGIAVMIWGMPGIGKSDIVYQTAYRMDRRVKEVRLSQLDPVDLRGIPSAVDGRTVWNIPVFLPDTSRDGEFGFLFIDEINSGSQATQAAAYQLVLDRRLGDYVLPDGWSVIAAGNNEGDRAIVNRMATPLRNRFIHIDQEVNIDDWRLWAIEAKIRTEVLGFIAFRSALLCEFNDERARNAKAFATPRSWEFVSRTMMDDPNYAEELEFYSCVIGDGPAAEFLSYLKFHRSLPNIDGILLNPTKAALPKEPATLYALMTTLATRASPDNFEAITQYINRLDEAEFGTLCVKDAATRCSDIMETPAFTNWSVKHGSLLI